MHYNRCGVYLDYYSYLWNRQQYVKVGNNIPETLTVTNRVIQGSTLNDTQLYLSLLKMNLLKFGLKNKSWYVSEIFQISVENSELQVVDQAKNLSLLVDQNWNFICPIKFNTVLISTLLTYAKQKIQNEIQIPPHKFSFFNSVFLIMYQKI